MSKLYLVADLCSDPYYGLQFPKAVYADLESVIKGVQERDSDPWAAVIEVSENGFKDVTKDIVDIIDNETGVDNT